jgi:hypothetical protein
MEADFLGEAGDTAGEEFPIPEEMIEDLSLGFTEETGADASEAVPGGEDPALSEEDLSLLEGAELSFGLTEEAEADEALADTEDLSLSEEELSFDMEADFLGEAGDTAGEEFPIPEGMIEDLSLDFTEETGADASKAVPGGEDPALSEEDLSLLEEEDLSLLEEEDLSLDFTEETGADASGAVPGGEDPALSEEDLSLLEGEDLSLDFTEETGADASEAVPGGEDPALSEEDLSLLEGEDLSLDFTEETEADAGGAVPGGEDPALSEEDLSLLEGEDLSLDMEAGSLEETNVAGDMAGEELPLPEETVEELSGDDAPEAADSVDLSFGETVEGEPAVDEPGVDNDLFEDTDLFIEDISFEGLETEGEGIDLSNAVIDEPDLGVEIQENPVEELSENISLDPDEPEGEEALVEEESGLSGLEETAEAEFSMDLSEELTLDDSLDQVIPEGFEVEPENSPALFTDDIGEESFEDVEAGGLGPEEEAVEDLPSLDVEEDLSPVPEAAAEETKTAPKGDFARSPGEHPTGSSEEISGNLKQEIKTVLSYMDKLLEALPEKKIEEFAKSEYFDTYKKLFKELGLV